MLAWQEVGVHSRPPLHPQEEGHRWLVVMAWHDLARPHLDAEKQVFESYNLSVFSSSLTPLSPGTPPLSPVSLVPIALVSRGFLFTLVSPVTPISHLSLVPPVSPISYISPVFPTSPLTPISLATPITLLSPSTTVSPVTPTCRTCLKRTIGKMTQSGNVTSAV